MSPAPGAGPLRRNWDSPELCQTSIRLSGKRGSKNSPDGGPAKKAPKKAAKKAAKAGASKKPLLVEDEEDLFCPPTTGSPDDDASRVDDTIDEGLDFSSSPLFTTVFHRVILDEAHRIKSRTTSTCKAAMQLKARKRWCVTGTPLQNRVGSELCLSAFYSPCLNSESLYSLRNKVVLQSSRHDGESRTEKNAKRTESP